MQYVLKENGSSKNNQPGGDSRTIRSLVMPYEKISTCIRYTVCFL